MHRGGYRVLEADLHVHTTFSDGSLTPFGVVRQAARRGLDVIAVTEHNSVLPSKLARAFARLDPAGPLVLTGEEITTKRAHLIAVGLAETVPATTIEEAIPRVHAQGAVAIAAHPVARFWPALEPVRDGLDGAEVDHPFVYAARGPGGWRGADMVRFYEEGSPPLAAIGSSDYHWGSLLGFCRTLVFVEEPADEAHVLAALRARRTVVVTREGASYGDPALRAALAAEPYVPRTSDYRYEGTSTSDRVLRTLGFLGLVAAVVLGSARRERHEGSPPGPRELR